MRKTIFIMALMVATSTIYGQIDSSTFLFKSHKIQSEILNQQREFWVSLPLNYNDTSSYKVMYVLDAEWRFNLIRNIEYDYSANGKIDKHIIVGIPHIDYDIQRQLDLSFSQSRMEYDGEQVDSTWYNSSNSEGGMAFYKYMVDELMPAVESSYSTNGDNTLVGHSMGGYFGGYILSMNHPFSTLYLFDPSIWYGNGEVTKVIKNGVPKKDTVDILITFQPEPTFHKSKIEELVKELQGIHTFTLTTHLFDQETHNSLFLPSFLMGIEIEVQEKSSSSR